MARRKPCAGSRFPGGDACALRILQVHITIRKVGASLVRCLIACDVSTDRRTTRGEGDALHCRSFEVRTDCAAKKNETSKSESHDKFRIKKTDQHYCLVQSGIEIFDSSSCHPLELRFCASSHLKCHIQNLDPF